MCRKTISTPTGWPTVPRGGSPTISAVTRRLVEWLAERPADRVVYEPTGPYHRGVERAPGVPFVKVNPRQARRFAEATGKLAKTDRPGCGDAGSHGSGTGA
jgi:transposase